MLPTLNYHSTPPLSIPFRTVLPKQIADFALQTNTAEASIYRMTIPILFVCGLKKLVFFSRLFQRGSFLVKQNHDQKKFIFSIFQQAEE